jgi:hypothetical protein
MTPYELRALQAMRRRGQAPELAVFVMDDWVKAAQLTEEVGVLGIRVRNARDFEHDWSPLAGLWTYLWLRRSTAAELADFSAVILRANPLRLTTRIHDMPSVEVWDAERFRRAA